MLVENKNSIKRSIYAVCFLFAVSNHTSANEQAGSVFELSLEALIQIKVSVSSHRPEAIRETPAVISRYNMNDMAALGLRTLKDVLSFVPGLTVQDHLFGQPFVSMRGVYEGFNQKVLFLLDGAD